MKDLCKLKKRSQIKCSSKGADAARHDIVTKVVDRYVGTKAGEKRFVEEGLADHDGTRDVDGNCKFESASKYTQRLAKDRVHGDAGLCRLDMHYRNIDYRVYAQIKWIREREKTA
jgi:hypothetical protein